MERFILVMFLLVLTACTVVQPIKKSHGLTGGVKEVTAADYERINCWVQPPHDELWYPCPASTELEGYLHPGGHSH